MQEAAAEATTYFVYDHEDVILDFVDDDGAAGPNGPVLDRRYLHGPGVDQILAQEDAAGNVVWHLADRLGTIHDLVDGSGAVVNHVTYDSYGNVISQTDPAVKTRYLYTGRELDTDTGLYYYRARYYDPQIGRFITTNPVGLSELTNIYTYAENAPVLFGDPSGLPDPAPTQFPGSTAGPPTFVPIPYPALNPPQTQPPTPPPPGPGLTLSQGDEAGTLKGLKSAKNMDNVKAKPFKGGFCVKFEGTPILLLK